VAGGSAGPADEIDIIISGGADDIRAEDDAVAAEAWGSHLLGMFNDVRRQASASGLEVPPFEEAVLERCSQRSDADSLLVAAVLAPVLTPPLDTHARRIVDDLSGESEAPRWLDHIGRSAPSRAFVASDVFGDQDSLMIGFAAPDDAPDGGHALLVLVDHNLSGRAKDAWLADDLDETVKAWRSAQEERIRIEEVPADEAMRRLYDAMARTEAAPQRADERTEDFAEHRALIWGRLRRAGLGEAPVEDRTLPPADRRAIVADFLASEPGRAVVVEHDDIDVEHLATAIVDVRATGDGRPLRWSPGLVEDVLTESVPQEVVLDDIEDDALPDVVRAFVRFAADRTGLDGALRDEILAAVDAVEDMGFLPELPDFPLAGPASALLDALETDGVAINDPAEVMAALESLSEGSLPGIAPPRSGPPSAEIIDEASATPILSRFDVLAGFYGDGRKLTQTGQPTLADARRLVEILGTADRFDETIGDRTFKTKSAAELPELAFTLRWAVAAGVLRKQHGKYLTTKKWRNMDSKPLQRWEAAADALAELGPLEAFNAGSRYRGSDEVLDELAPELLYNLGILGDLPFDVALDSVCERADDLYEWRGYMEDPARRRRSLGWDLARLVTILELAGIVGRTGVPDPDPDERDPRHPNPGGGVLRLTTVGRWWLGS
jgi:hypothetical protein